MSRNELGDGIVVDTDWFQMLRRHSNTVYGRNISCACVVAVTYVMLDVIEKSETMGEGTGARRV